MRILIAVSIFACLTMGQVFASDDTKCALGSKLCLRKRLAANEKPGTVHCETCPVYCTRTVCDLSGCRDEQYICQWQACNCGGY